MKWITVALLFSLAACGAQLRDMSDDSYCRNAVQTQGRKYEECRNRVSDNRNAGTINLNVRDR